MEMRNMRAALPESPGTPGACREDTDGDATGIFLVFTILIIITVGDLVVKLVRDIQSHPDI